MIKFLFKNFISKVLTWFYFIFLKSNKFNIKILGIKKYKKDIKKSDTLFIMASGSSINSYTKNDFNLIKKFDSIGVNNFILHDFNPNCYILEPHKNELGYFDILNKKVDQVRNIHFLYKGYAHYSKIKLVFSNFSIIPSSLKKIWLLKDSYVPVDVEISKVERCIFNSRNDYFYNYVSSLNYLLFLGYKVGYKKIVLCGFDMDDKYFYCLDESKRTLANHYNLCNEENKNIVNTDESRLSRVYKVINIINDKLEIERDGGVFIYKEGKLSSKIALYKEI